MGQVNFYAGLFANLPATRSEDTLYFCTDTHQIFKGAAEYTKGTKVLESEPTVDTVGDLGRLYSYNGKSTSRAKVQASKENGKKGGRPPKEITNLKERKTELEESVLPDLRREKSVTTDLELEEKLNLQISVLLSMSTMRQ